MLHFQKKKFKKKILMIRKYCKVRNHCHYTGKYRGAALNIFNFRYSIPKEIPFSQLIKLSLSFYHKRANWRIWRRIWLSRRKYREVHNLFNSDEKRIKNNWWKREKINSKIISYRLKIIDNVRFVVSPLSNLANISLREFIKLSANMEMIIKKMWNMLH